MWLGKLGWDGQRYGGGRGAEILFGQKQRIVGGRSGGLGGCLVLVMGGVEFALLHLLILLFLLFLFFSFPVSCFEPFLGKGGT